MDKARANHASFHSHDERADMSTPHTQQPVDTWYKAYATMLLFGVGSLFPWNAMITPVEYFQMRLRKTPYEQPFESVMSVAFCSVSFATVVVLQANPTLLTMRKRILISLSMLLVVFTTLTACAVQAALWPLDVFEQHLLAHADQQFAIILLSAAVAGGSATRSDASARSRAEASSTSSSAERSEATVKARLAAAENAQVRVGDRAFRVDRLDAPADERERHARARGASATPERRRARRVGRDVREHAPDLPRRRGMAYGSN